MSVNRILILDTDPRICRLLSRMANDLGFETFYIDKSNLFKDAFQSFQPNIILLDIDLEAPQLEAIHLLDYLATQYSRAAIILMTCMNISNLSKIEKVGKSLDLNMAGSLTKPIVLDQCKYKFKKYLKDTKQENDSSGSISKSRSITKHNYSFFYNISST